MSFFKKIFATSLGFLILTGTAPSHAQDLVSCSSGGSCDIGVFRSDDPGQYKYHTIKIIPPVQSGTIVSIPSTNQVTFSFDGTNFSAVCDGAWHNFSSPASSELQNKCSCAVDRSATGGTGVAMSLRIYGQNVYAHSYVNCPGQTIDLQLKNSSIGVPFCMNSDLTAPVNACKWEKQNLNDPVLDVNNVPIASWVIYARTDVTDLLLSYNIPTQNTPFSDGDTICMADINKDGQIDSTEMSRCAGTAQGNLCPLAAKQCINGACPSDSSRPCMDVDGQNYCSPYDCKTFNSGSSVVADDTQTGITDKKDDGQVNANGDCMGTIYIFNGKDSRCRTAGIETAYHDCCEGSANASVPDNPIVQYDLAIKIDAIMWTTVVNALGKCKSLEDQLSLKKGKGLCHYVGSYCALKTAFGICLQRKKTFCCFNSKLGRILQEQGRPLLKDFAQIGWGTPKSPECRGFTADEFQMLDFSKMDLSGWYSDITTTTTGQITNQIKNTVQSAYGN